MIRPEQLVQALERIHPRDRELLSLSLRRRVPDEALARLYDCGPTDVARRRARAIERLADEMGLQRGEDLGAVLKALLEPETWSAAAAKLGEEFALEAGGTRLTHVPPPDDAEIKAMGPALAPVPAQPEGDRMEEDAPAGATTPPPSPLTWPAPAAPAAKPTPPTEASPEGDGPAQPAAEPTAGEPAAGAAAPPGAEPDAPPAAKPAASPPLAAPNGAAAVNGGSAPAPPTVAPPLQAAPPVLEILADRERQAPDPPRRAVPLALLGLSVASLVGAAGIVGATQFGETTRVIQPSGGDGDDNTRHFLPEQGGPLAAPFPTDSRTISCYSTAYVPRSTVLYREPGGRKRIKITARTEWGSPRVLGVLKQRGGWLGVQAAELKNGEIGWVRREQTRVDCVRWSLHADLSKRTLFVRRDGHTVKKMRVAIGRSANPTPKGRFTVTDKLRVTDPNSAYGCCVLALSGHQTDLPDYWPGGDRLAVHATSDESSIGKRVSLGCLRTQAPRARWLIETVPLGAPIFIRA